MKEEVVTVDIFGIIWWGFSPIHAARVFLDCLILKNCLLQLPSILMCSCAMLVIHACLISALGVDQTLGLVMRSFRHSVTNLWFSFHFEGLHADYRVQITKIV